MYDIQLASKITATHCSPEGVSMRYRRRGKKIGYERFESVRVVCEAITASSMLRLIRNDVRFELGVKHSAVVTGKIRICLRFNSCIRQKSVVSQ